MSSKQPSKRTLVRALCLITLAGVLFCLPVDGVSSAESSGPAAPRPSPSPKKRNQVISDPPVVDLKSSSSLLKFCPPATGSADCSTSREVSLSATTGDHDSDLTFKWSVTAGRIRGNGPKVIWDLSGVAEGTYTASVEATDRDNLSANAATGVTISPCQSCVTLESPCPTIAVSCPATGLKQALNFEAHVYGGDPDFKVTYSWTVSSGKIIRGQNTSTITVDASDSGNQAVTGKVTVGGTLPECFSTASCTTELPVPAVSPTPVPTPDRESKRPNPLRRLLSWTTDKITRPFRREPPFFCYLPPPIDLTASKSSITFCPTAIASAGCSPDREITLTARGPDSDSQFLFTWEVTAGKIRGEGHEVIWDLSGVNEGSYTATVEMNDGNQHTTNAATTVTIAPCCDAPPPPCPSVSVSCPSDTEKQPITFEATVTGGDPEMKPTYNWSVTAGKIIRGQGTSKLTIDTSNAGGRPVTATVSLEGVHPACTISPASCTVGIH